MIFNSNTLRNRQDRAAARLNEILAPSDLVLVCAGSPIQKPGGLDQTYSYIPHPSYYWISGRRRVEGVMTYSSSEGWKDYTKPHSPEESLWEGSQPESDAGLDLADLAPVLSNDSGRKLYFLGQPSPALLNGKNVASAEETLQAQIRLEQARRIKDPAEVALIEQAAHIAKRGYERIQAILKPGITEKNLRIEYEAEIQRAGAHGVPYDTIVGAGSNAAILHAIPTSRVIKDQDLVLIDAGAELYDYCVDITRVYAATKFNSRQQALYNLVKSAQAEAISQLRPGLAWSAVHGITARVIANGLKQMGLIKSSVDAALESAAISVFYPHGVGHLVGLRVRDTGHVENRNPQKHYGVRLRVDLNLEENYLVTVEPGCYFVEALISDEKIRSQYADFIEWREVDSWRGIGGVRIEDDILITRDGARNLTDIVSK